MASIQPLTVKAIIGIRQKIGLRTKLKSKTEAFLAKMSVAVRIGGSEANVPPNSSRAAMSSEIVLVMLAGVAKPNIKPIANNKIAMKLHLL
jgi:starvation-inducible outer membrane lipoprotein